MSYIETASWRSSWTAAIRIFDISIFGDIKRRFSPGLKLAFCLHDEKKKTVEVYNSLGLYCSAVAQVDQSLGISEKILRIED